MGHFLQRPERQKRQSVATSALRCVFGCPGDPVNNVNFPKPLWCCSKTEVRRNQENEPRGAHGAAWEQLLEGLGELWGDFGRHRDLLFCLLSSFLTIAQQKKQRKKARRASHKTAVTNLLFRPLFGRAPEMGLGRVLEGPGTPKVAKMRLTSYQNHHRTVSRILDGTLNFKASIHTDVHCQWKGTIFRFVVVLHSIHNAIV